MQIIYTFLGIQESNSEKFLLLLQHLLIYLQLFHSTLVIQQVFFRACEGTQQYFYK